MIGYYRERRKQVREISVERRKKTITVHSEHECGIVDKQGNVKDILLKAGESPGGRSCASLIDITSHRRAQEALRESEKKLGAIVESLGGYIYTATRDYRIDFMNRALVSRYGRDGTGERCHEVIHGLAEPCPSCDQHRIFAGQSITKEIKSPKDGRWFHIVNSPICDEQGAVVKRQSLLVDHFMQSFPADKRQAITWKIMDALMRHDWPGNVRELRNAIHRYLTLGELDFMGLRQAGAEGADLLMDPDFVSKVKDYQSAPAQFEKNLISSMLEMNKWHREKTARDLGLNRQTFFRKLNKLGLIGPK